MAIIARIDTVPLLMFAEAGVRAGVAPALVRECWLIRGEE